MQPASHFMLHSFGGGEAFGVRQLAAAFETSPMFRFFRGSLKSGSKLPHSEGALRAQKQSGSLRSPSYFDFFSCLAFLFSMMDFAGFFLTSFLASLDFAITNILR